MKSALVIVVFVGALGAAMFYRLEEDRRATFESDHRYIYGFHLLRSPRQFGEYLDPVTADGLHEIRWDRMLPRAFSIAVSSTSSNWVIVPTTGSTGSTTLTCSTPVHVCGSLAVR